jgi:hypothetical protein
MSWLMNNGFRLRSSFFPIPPTRIASAEPPPDPIWITHTKYRCEIIHRGVMQCEVIARLPLHGRGEVEKAHLGCRRFGASRCSGFSAHIPCKTGRRPAYRCRCGNMNHWSSADHFLFSHVMICDFIAECVTPSTACTIHCYKLLLSASVQK